MKKILVLSILLIGFLLYGVYNARIGTGMYYAEFSIVRWKFAIYIGECNDETGCNYLKLENNGFLEWIGIHKIKLSNGKYATEKFN